MSYVEGIDFLFLDRLELIIRSYRISQYRTYNYVLSKSRLVHKLWTQLTFISAFLVANPMTIMTTTNSRRRLHFSLQHALVACMLCYLWKNTHLEKIFDHIVSQSRYLLDLFPNNLFYNMYVSTLPEILSNVLLSLDKLVVHIHGKFDL